MKKYMLSILIILIFLTSRVSAQTQGNKLNHEHHYPSVPRVSAYEAYNKYRSGKAIILHAGGNDFKNRHVVGALNIDFKPRENFIARLPKRGIELLLYCY